MKIGGRGVWRVDRNQLEGYIGSATKRIAAAIRGAAKRERDRLLTTTPKRPTRLA